VPEFQLKTPVAFIIFNRPDTTARVFAEIAKAKPPKLLVVGDGHRVDRPGEAEQVADARAIITHVDWDCEVLTNFSEVNLGCKRRPASGIDWVFEQVEEAIILEDDCLPDPTFFRFCQELLERYRHDQRIGMISGDNFQFGYQRNDDSYYFSRYTHIWGWATWRDRWQGTHDLDMAHWPKVRDEGWIHDMLPNRKEAEYWAAIFERVHRGELDNCWDYQWTFACWLQGRSTILPNQNLISNIGFGLNATHTTVESELANLPLEKMNFPLKHPLWVVGNHTLDDRAFKRIFSRSLPRRVRNKMVRMFGL
jgi:hypothetical protein